MKKDPYTKLMFYRKNTTCIKENVNPTTPFISDSLTTILEEQLKFLVCGKSCHYSPSICPTISL